VIGKALTVIPEMERPVGAPMRRVLADRGYCAHNAPPDRKFRVFIADQKWRMTKESSAR
jgi:IS5 family transposase